MTKIIVLALFATSLAAAQDPQLQKIMEMLAEQQRMIESLRDTVESQQKTIDRLEGRPAPVPPKPVAPQVSQTPFAAVTTATSDDTRKWFEKYAFRGYTQIRHNGIVETNPLLGCEQCDRFIGNNNNVAFRRARFILSGDVTDRIYIYFQPDFASTSGNLNFAQVRDLYFDLAFDQKKEFRVRVGQSKIPYSFENLQSSQNRLALDRNDALNSAAANERDIGAFFYYAPAHIRTRFASLVSSGLKGSGDYGVVGTGVYNGQTANRAESNNNIHYVARVTYPWQLKSGQFIEAGIQGYTGRYTVSSDQRTAATRGPADFTFADQRVAASLIYYPQPFGFQSEFTVGKGPQFNPSTRTIDNRTLKGGYAQTMYMKKLPNSQTLTPFYRFQYYSGGKKQELDARRYLVRDHDFGVEWQQNSFLEIVGQYTVSDRTYEDAVRSNNRQKGQLLRLQLQLNY